MPKNINYITNNITLEGIEKIKTEKNDNKTLKNIFFTNAVRKRQQTLKCLLDFDWLLRSYDYLILTFLLVYFSWLKYILAHKMRHNARQSDNNI